MTLTASYKTLSISVEFAETHHTRKCIFAVGLIGRLGPWACVVAQEWNDTKGQTDARVTAVSLLPGPSGRRYADLRMGI